MRRSLAWLAALAGAAAPCANAGGSQVITVAATVLSSSNCVFRNGSASAIAVGPIDPALSTSFTATAPVIVRCAGSAPNASFSISNSNGLYGTAPSALRMRHATQTTEFLAYTLSYPTSGTIPKSTDTTLNVTASVSASAYQAAAPGAYQDVVTLTISP